MLAALWANGKSVFWALEMILLYGPKSKRMLSAARATERALMRAMGTAWN